MELGDGYKQTEVGVIPEDWVVYTISELTSILGDGIHSTPLYSNSGGYFFINGNNLLDGSVFLAETTKRVDRVEYLKHKKVLNDRTIFLSINGTIGNLAYYNSEPVILGKSAAYLNVKEKYAKVYFYYALQTETVAHFFEDGITGTTIKNLGLGTIRNTPIPLPQTKAEQTAIANALNDADTWIQSLTRLIAKKRQIKQGAMQTLLNPRENGQLKEGWVVKKLGDVANIRSGGTPSTLRAEFWNGNVLWCTPTDITALKGNKYLYSTSRKITLKGLANSSAEIITEHSIVMTSRATIGECAINLLPVSTNQGFKNFVPNEDVDTEFLYYILLTHKQSFIGLCSGSTFLEISKGQVCNYSLALPNNKDEQTRIATILSDIDNEITALETKLAKAKTIKQGMMQNLLTGRIRLI